MSLIAVYLLFMARHGLPWLPSSVLTKSVAAASLGRGPLQLFESLGGMLKADFHELRAYVLAASLAFFVVVAIKQRVRPRRLAIYGPLCVAIAAHLLLGAYGWFYRYEVYICAISLLGTGIAIRDLVGGAPSSQRQSRDIQRLFVVLSIGFSYPYVSAALETPNASAGIYDQQYQMRRFAQDFYREPVGVNDLGLVSYGNSHYVLDLVGLGSEEVRKLRSNKSFSRAAMEQLTNEHDIGLVMIYDSWFPDGIPASWARIATLLTPRGASSKSTVTFYATPIGGKAAILSALAKLQADLPEANTLQIFDAGA